MSVMSGTRATGGWTAARRPAAAALALLAQAALAQAPDPSCGNPFVNHFGPYDYRTAPASTKALVENIHFTAGVASLTKPATTMFSMMGQDIGYTLQVFPNHPRALLTMERAGDRFRRDPPPGANFTVECWYLRAVRFRPDDTVARGLYAQFLGRRKRIPEAARQLDQAAEIAKDNALSLFSIGLVFVELGLHEKALRLAHRVQAMGYPRPELINALKAAGRWSEPPDAAQAPAPAASAASSNAPG